MIITSFGGGRLEDFKSSRVCGLESRTTQTPAEISGLIGLDADRGFTIAPGIDTPSPVADALRNLSLEGVKLKEEEKTPATSATPAVVPIADAEASSSSALARRSV